MKLEILKANSKLSHIHIQSMLRRWFMETEGAEKVCGALVLPKSFAFSIVCEAFMGSDFQTKPSLYGCYMGWEQHAVSYVQDEEDNAIVHCAMGGKA